MNQCGIDYEGTAFNADILECENMHGFSSQDYLLEIKPKFLRYTEIYNDICSAQK